MPKRNRRRDNRRGRGWINKKMNKVESMNGKIINIKVDSIWLHGDGVKAVKFAKKIRQELEKENLLWVFFFFNIIISFFCEI